MTTAGLSITVSARVVEPTPPDWHGKEQSFYYKRGNTITIVLPAGVTVSEWKSSNERTATVNNGVVVLRARGTAIITAVVGDAVYTFTVHVKFSFWNWLVYIFAFGWGWMK